VNNRPNAAVTQQVHDIDAYTLIIDVRG